MNRAAYLALVVSRGRYGCLAAAAIVGVALPGLFVYDITFVQVGAPDAKRGASEDPG